MATRRMGSVHYSVRRGAVYHTCRNHGPQQHIVHLLALAPCDKEPSSVVPIAPVEVDRRDPHELRVGKPSARKRLAVHAHDVFAPLLVRRAVVNAVGLEQAAQLVDTVSLHAVDGLRRTARPCRQQDTRACHRRGALCCRGLDARHRLPRSVAERHAEHVSDEPAHLNRQLH